MQFLTRSFHFLCGASLLASLTLFGCSGKKVTLNNSEILPSSKKDVLQRELQLISTLESDPDKRKDIVDIQLRAASMALDIGDSALARQLLIDATSFMAGGIAAKYFSRHEQQALKTLGGEEMEKIFLGDPYEQFFAFLYLGILDFQLGEYELARSSFRSAILADEGSRTEGYKSDSYLAFLLEGLTNRVLGDDDLAFEACRLAQKAYSFRQTMGMLKKVFYVSLSQLLQAQPSEKTVTALNKLFPVIFGQLPTMVFFYEDPFESSSQAFANTKEELELAIEIWSEKSFLQDNVIIDTFGEAYNYVEGFVKDATDMLSLSFAEEEEQNEIENWKDSIQGYLKEVDDSDLARQYLEDFEQLVQIALTKEKRDSLQNDINNFQTLINSVLHPETNLFVLHQIGNGPMKIRRGKYGQVVHFGENPSITRDTLIIIKEENSPLPVAAGFGVNGETVSYQATTRGGRELDSLLEGRVLYRDAANIGSDISLAGSSVSLVGVAGGTAMTALGISSVTGTVSFAGYTATATVGAGIAAPAAVAAIGAYGLYKIGMKVSDSIHPEADIRGWHELPEKIVFMTSKLPVGRYELSANCFDTLGNPLHERKENRKFSMAGQDVKLLLTGSPWSM